MSWSSFFLVFLGGGLGSLTRFSITRFTSLFYASKFPLATLISNTFACIAVGLILYLFKDKVNESDSLKYFWIIGFCGGFSTFSALSHQTIQLFQDGYAVLGVTNIVLSLALGLGILFVFMRS